AMLPFCGYNMGDYFNHWLSIGKSTTPDKLPHIYYVNWFRKGDRGEWLWPGFGDNSRVLKWIFERTSGAGQAVKTPIGYVPSEGALDLSGLSLSSDSLRTLLTVDLEGWKKEVEELRHYFKFFGERLPAPLAEELHALEKRLNHLNHD